MKKEKVFMICIPILLVILVIVGYLQIKNGNSCNDSIKFKNEYEVLNNKKENDIKYYKVDIDKSNPVKYSSYDEVFDVIKSGSGIIYFGYSKDNNSRFAIDTLLNVIKENNVDTTVYYLDIKDDRDSYTIEGDKLVYSKDSSGNEIKGSKNYFKLLKLLDDYLSEYILILEDKEYDVGEKRIHFPSMVFVSDGKILGVEYSSTSIEYDDLYSIYESYIYDMYPTTCNTKEPC